MVGKLVDYRDTVGEPKITELYKKASDLSNKHILHINSTYYGGGVAEIMKNLVPLMNDVGIEVGWRIVQGSHDFFRTTKNFHNALQGGDLDLTKAKKRIYEETNETFSKFIHLKHDLVVVHDLQPLPLIRFYERKQPWIWRCHVDLSEPDEDLWWYLKSFILPYDQVVYQMEEFAGEGVSNHSVVMPSIDPLSEKNCEISEKIIDRSLKKLGLDESKPIITQISRFDRWKDPEGVLKVFDLVREEIDCQLVLMGSMASDDPEGQQIYGRVFSKTEAREDVKLVTDALDITVNSIQRASDVVLQKSIKEGFGLTVSEALWKETPVVASNVGGIPTQVIDGETGYLVDPYDYERAAERILDFLGDDGLSEEMGKRGKQHVKENFLITRHLEDWMDLWKDIFNTNL